MMMQMLTAGGLAPVTDNLRQADDDNLAGYFELERVKELDKAADKAWLREARGKAVKVISQLLKHLPSEHAYQILFLERSLEEVLASQRAMLTRRGEEAGADDPQMASLFRSHLLRVKVWLRHQPNIEVLFLDYGEILRNPTDAARRVAEFLDRPLDVERMVQVVNPEFYRQRRHEGTKSRG